MCDIPSREGFFYSLQHHTSDYVICTHKDVEQRRRDILILVYMIVYADVLLTTTSQ